MHVSDIASVVQAVVGGQHGTSPASKAPVLVAHSFGGLIAQKWVARGERGMPACLPACLEALLLRGSAHSYSRAGRCTHETHVRGLTATS